MRLHLRKNFFYVILIVSCYMSIRVLMVRFHSQSDDSQNRRPKLVPEQVGHIEVQQKPLEEPQNVEISNNTKDTGNAYGQGPCSSRVLDVPLSIQREDASFSDVTCASLLTGSEKDPVYDRAKEFMKRYPIKAESDKTISVLTKDCQKFKSSRGYHTESASQDEQDFPIAFNILVHKDAYQVERLLRTIYRPHNQYCVHIDAKQPVEFRQAVQDLVSCFSNVFLASKMESVVYAGFTRLQADVTCMKDHLSHDKSWKYLINIAGQAFPIKTNHEMVQILRIYNGSNDIEGIIGNRIHRSRFEVKWVEQDVDTDHVKLVKTPEKNPKPPFDIEIVRGSAYGIFSRAFVNFIINDERAQALLKWSRYTWSPDEHFWSTLHHTYYNPHLNTPGGYNGKPDAKRWLAVWVAWGGENKCHGKWVRGICVFGVGDLPKIASREEFFINKLYYDFEPLTLECLNNFLEERVTCPRDIDWKFYKNLPFIKKGDR